MVEENERRFSLAELRMLAFGALARETGRSHFRPEDDVAVGLMIRHQLSAAGVAERRRDEALAALLLVGLDPRDLTREQSPGWQICPDCGLMQPPGLPIRHGAGCHRPQLQRLPRERG